MKYNVVFLIVMAILLVSLLAACKQGNISGSDTTGTALGGQDASLPQDSTPAGERPTDLRINLLSTPFGVDRKELCFSWVVNSSHRNTVQTAYRILVAQSADQIAAREYLFDSGWVESAQNTGVFVPALGDALADNTLYYWQVVIRHSNGGQDLYSEPQAFSTAVGEQWTATNGIWAATEGAAGGKVQASEDWSDYDMETRFVIDSNALGLVFRAVDTTNFYMWQFKVENGKAMLCPHVYRNGKFVGGAAIAKISVPSEVAFAVGDTVQARVHCEGNTVKTYLANASGEYVLIDQRDMSNYGFTQGTIGLRTGSTESGKVYSISVRSLADGGLLWESDFPSGVNPFAKCTISDGVLSVRTSLGSGDLLNIGRSKDSFVFMRTELALREAQLSKLDRAILSVTATSPEATRQFVYNMYINGALIGIGPSRYGKTPEGDVALYYNTYDVTDQLTAGKNCLATINYATSGRAFLSQLTLHYTDGSSEVVSNSAKDFQAWRVFSGDAAFGIDNSIGTHHYSAHANNIDATCYPYGFAEVGYDDQQWNDVFVGKAIAGNMVLLPSETDNLSRYVSQGEVTVQKLSSGDYVIDLGGEIIGGVRFTVNLPAAAKLKVYYGEQLGAYGTVKYRMLSGNVYTETWTLVEGDNTIETIDMLAYRYIQISGCPVEITPDMVQGLEIRAPFDDTESSFTSDNTLLNDIYDLMKRTVKMTTQDLYVDSQSRERLAYEGDLVINLLAAYAFSNDYSVGRFSSEYAYTHFTWPAEYWLLTAVSAMDDYMATGDISSLKAYYNAIKERTYTSYLDQEVGLLNLGADNGDILIDWPETERNGYDTKVAFNTVLNAVAVLSYEKLAEIAELTGHENDAAEFASLAKTIKSAMIEKLYDAEKGAFADGLYADGTRSSHYAQHATAYALACGIYRDQDMADALAATIEEQGQIRMSVYGAFFLLKGLYDSNNGSVANKLLLDENTAEGARTWAYMLYKMDATITTEAWNPKNKDNMTLCHAWGAAPAHAIMSGIFGITPTSAGYSTFDVRFQTEGIGTASLTVPTIQGSITASFSEGSDAYTASVTVPANTQATVYLPASEGMRCTVNGSAAEGVYENGFLCVTVGSGSWEFQVA